MLQLCHSHIRRTMSSPPPRDCVGSSCVWGLAAQLMTHGHSGFAFDICFYLSRVKSAIKFILK